MSKTGTYTLTLRFCLHRLTEQLRDVALTLSMFGAHERRRLAVARNLAKADPHIDIQVVTMADGVCRVAVRRLGGWGCSCGRADIHPRLVSHEAGAAARVGVGGEGPPPSDVAADGPGASLHSGEASPSHSSPAGEARPTTDQPGGPE